MISNDELHQKLQAESYKIICESISEEDRSAMNLTKEQIMPTIIFFRKMQKELFHKFFQGDIYNRGIAEYEYCFEKFNFEEDKFIIEPEVINVNLSFLKSLCLSVGIEFYTFEDRYHFETSKSNLCNDVKKKYHI